MRKKSAISAKRVHHSPVFYAMFGVITFFVGIIVAIVTTTVLAQTANNTISACVNNNTGLVRVTTGSDACRQVESPLSWNIQGPPGPPGVDNDLPYHCNNCQLFGHADKFRGKDFSDAQIFNTEFRGADLTGVIFKGAYFRNLGFNDSNLTNADFSELARRPLQACPPTFNCHSSNITFSNANLTNATFAGSIAHSFDFRTANLQNTDFSNTLIRQSRFQGATNASTANFTGATWVNTTCPDGTNSDSNGNTCEGHL